jgi:hypothetical protein
MTAAMVDSIPHLLPDAEPDFATPCQALIREERTGGSSLQQ